MDESLNLDQFNKSIIPGGYPGQQVAELPPIAPLNQNIAPIEPVVPQQPQQYIPQQSQTGSETISQPQQTPAFDTAKRDYLKAEAESQRAQKSALLSQSRRDEAIADAEAQTANAQAIESANRAKQEIELANTKNAEYTERIKAIDANVNELKSMKMQDYFENKGIGSKILAAFAIGLGSISGNKNNALDIINKTIDADSQRQIQAYNAKKDVISGMRESLNTARQLGLNEQDTRTYLNSLKTISVTDQLNSKLAQIKKSNPTVAMEMESKLAQMNTQSKQNILDLESKSAGTIQKTKAYAPVNAEEMDKQTGALFSQYTKDSRVARASELRASLENILASEKTGIGDINMVYAFAKAMDPMGSVRDGDLDTIAKAQSIPVEIRQKLIKAITNGGVYSEDMRNQFIGQATKNYANYEKKILEPINKQFAARAQRSGVNPNEFLLPKLSESIAEPAQLSQQDSAAVQWAKANPKDPRSQKILQLNQGEKNASK